MTEKQITALQHVSVFSALLLALADIAPETHV
jgi:hypothetical protein